jgi:hypothetical protein
MHIFIYLLACYEEPLLIVPRYNKNDYTFVEFVLNSLNECPQVFNVEDRITITNPRLNVYFACDPNQMVKLMAGITRPPPILI